MVRSNSRKSSTALTGLSVVCIRTRHTRPSDLYFYNHPVFTCQLQHELASSGSNARRIYFFPESSSLLSFPARLVFLARQRKDATSILPLYKRISSSVQTNFSDTTLLEDFDLNFPFLVIYLMRIDIYDTNFV